MTALDELKARGEHLKKIGDIDIYFWPHTNWGRTAKLVGVDEEKMQFIEIPYTCCPNKEKLLEIDEDWIIYVHFKKNLDAGRGEDL